MVVTAVETRRMWVWGEKKAKAEKGQGKTISTAKGE